MNPFPFPSDSDSSFHHNPRMVAEYAVWLQDLKPRTCLLVHWLASMGAIYEPDAPTHYKAKKFASKRVLLGKLVESSDELLSNKTNWLIENREFDLYVAHLMWLRFNEYVPRRFVLPEGRTKVLAWVRQQLRRSELTDDETIVELQYQIDRINEMMGETDEIQSYFKA